MDQQITIKQLKVGYHETDTLITMDELFIHSGQLIGLVGVNGCGKSTLLRTLANFQKALTGIITINSQELSTIPSSELAKLVSVVLTDQISMGYGTVFDVVASGRFPFVGSFGKLKKEDTNIINHALELVGMSGHANKPMDNLSDGQRQKIVLAKSLAQETPFILLDEPMAFLDLPSKMELSYLLHDISKSQGKGILLSTHDLDLAMHTCDKMWLVSDKKIIEGIPEDLALNGLFSDVFDTSSVAFNNLTGHFEFARTSTKQVRIECDNPLDLFWLKKALARIGVLVDDNAKNSVKKLNVGWEVKTEQHNQVVENIEQVITLLL
jgi:iron complex transport system ATP-binding protein